nr:EOG090X037N [Eurycercus lamellatus]
MSNYFNNFVPASQPAAGTQAYGASAGPPVTGYHSAGGHSAPAAGQTSYDTAYPNTAAFAGPGKPDGPGLPPAHYQGYEAALFNAAQAYLHQQTGPKTGPVGGGGGGGGGVGPGHGNKAGPGQGGGNAKTRGRYFNGGGGGSSGGGGGGGNFNQRWTSSSAQQLHYCEVCKISCASPQTYKDHLDGQKHKKKEAAIRTGLPMVPTPRTGAALHCELCNVTCTSSDAYAAHIRGTKHQKVVKLHTKLGKPIPPAEPQLIHNSKVTGAAPTATGTAPAAGTTPAAPTTSTPAAGTSKVVAPAPKINFLGGNYLNTAQSKAGGPEGDSNASASQIKSEVPMTAAAATETALSVVAQWEEEKVIQPVGQDYVEELRGPDGKINGFNCRLCDCRFNDVNAKDMHLKGRRHRLMYKKKVDPNLVVEAKGWPAQRQKSKTGAWQERKKGDWDGEVFEEMPPGGPHMEDGQPRPPAYWASPSRGMRHGVHSIGLPPPPQYFPAGPMPMGMPNPAMRKPESSDDRHVLAKHADIYPSDTELEAIQALVSYVERALKLVSDQLTNQPEEIKSEIKTEDHSLSVATATTPAPTTVVPVTPASASAPAPQRMLKGVMRVGLLAKGLLLKGDRTVQLVVLCSQPPTFQLLDRVAQALPTHLAVVAPTVAFTVSPFPDQAFVEVKSIQGHGLSGDIVVKVSLTSPVVREEQLAAAAANGDVDMKEMQGRLNTKDCLHALALLRRAKWFQARANSLQNCVLVIRVMRDFCLRTKAWSNLDFWAMELIVERAAFSAGTPLSPGDAIRRVFETLSTGILLTTGDGWSPGIGDPCEKDAVDACANLTIQEREDITASSQMRGVVVVIVPDRRRGLVALMLGLAVLAPLAAMATVNNKQMRVKPQPSSSVSSGLPVPDLLESPDAKYDPKPKDIDAAALRLRLKDHFDGRFMSIGQPKEAILYPNGTAEYPVRYNNNNNLSASSSKKANSNNNDNLRSKWNLGSLQLPDGTRVRTRLSRKVRKKLEKFLWLYTQCPVIYRWKDLGSRYWPRWIKQGRCHANQSCSFPPGMSCRASEEREVVILRWHCQYWDPPRFCKWIPLHYPIVRQCSCGCSAAKSIN